MSKLPTWWYRTEYYWIGTLSTTSAFSGCTHDFGRLPSLANAPCTQALLSNALFVLDTAAYRACLEDWKAPQGLQRTSYSSFGDVMADRVWFLLLIPRACTYILFRWSYTTSLTFIGNAIFVSMDIPDTFLGVSVCSQTIDQTFTELCSFPNYSTTLVSKRRK